MTQSAGKSMHADADRCEPADRAVTWPTVTGVCFQGRAASAGVLPHRPADHGSAGAAGISGSSGRTASAPVRVSGKAQALRKARGSGNLVGKAAGKWPVNVAPTGLAAL